MSEPLFSDGSIDTITVNRGELARVLDVSMPLISEFVAKGIVAEGPGGRINLVLAFRGVYLWQRRALEQRGGDQVQEEKRRLLIAHREMKELELRQRRGECVNKAQVVAASYEHGYAMLDGFDRLSIQLGPILAAEACPETVTARLKSDFRKLRVEGPPPIIGEWADQLSVLLAAEMDPDRIRDILTRKYHDADDAGQGDNGGPAEVSS